MKKSLDHLPLERREELKAIVDLVLEHDQMKNQVQMMILFGSYARGEAVGRDLHVEEGITYEYKSDYDILIIVPRKNHYRHAAFKTKLEALVKQLDSVSSPISFIVHDLDFVNYALEHASYFFCDIYKEGVELYNPGNHQLSQPKVLSPQKLYKIAQDDFEYWFEIANEFMIDAKHALQRNSHRKALFELHQCVENLYTTILLVYTHYKPKLHDLEKLRELVNNLDKRFHVIFPKRNKEEERLFEVLWEGYVNARYKKSFKILPDDLVILQQQAEEFIHLTKECCQGRLEELRQKAEAEPAE